MPNNNCLASFSYTLLALGFIGGVTLASCTAEQRKGAKTVVDVIETVCEFKSVLPKEATEVCLTEEEFRKAIKDIVSARSAAGASSAPRTGTLVVKLPPEAK